MVKKTHLKYLHLSVLLLEIISLMFFIRQHSQLLFTSSKSADYTTTIHQKFYACIIFMIF